MSPIYTPGKVVLRGPTVAPLLLDSYSGAAAAYSLRQLSWAYGGPAVRVRRSNDNAEQDFTATEVNDGTLAAWVGAGNNGFARTWYDQTGNGRNATQTTATKQPQIVLSGTVNLLNTKPALKFDGSDDFLTGGDVLDLESNSLTGFAFSELGANGTIYAKSRASFVTGRYSMIAESSITKSLVDLTFDATVSSVFAKGLFCQQVINGATNKLFVNSIERASAAIGSYSSLNTANRFLLGAYNNSTDTGEILLLNGSMSEVILYLSDQSANRNGIQSNINAHYNIYP